MKKENLDFLVIGAQKSGTTTLFKLLEQNPNIYMPSGKEVPFILDDELFSQGLDYNLKLFFSKGDALSSWGTVTPHYLSDPRSPTRIQEMMPDIKLIVILRDPAERALSHYKMSVRRGLETRSFDEAVRVAMEPEEVSRARSLLIGPKSESFTYLAWGEYGRLISKFLELFPRENLLVLFSKDLECHPEKVMSRVFEFLAVKDTKIKDAEKRYNTGGGGKLLSYLRKVRYLPFAKSLWRKIHPNTRSAFFLWLNEFGPKKDIGNQVMLDDYLIARQLRAYFIKDTALLSKMIGEYVPWSTKEHEEG